MKAAADATRIGEIVGGKYRIVRLLARGGMGVVYEAHHAVVRRRFAIKFLRRDLAERRDILNRFQREAEAAGALENDNVTAAVDFGISDDGAPFIVMEYLVGESLADLLEREGRLPVQRAADLVAQACRGVEAAHARRDRPSRSEAAQPVRGPPRRRHGSAEGPRLRRREAAGARRGDRGDGHGNDPRHGGVHVARAGARREGRRQADRRLRAGRDPVRDPVPEDAPPRRLAERDPASHRDAARGAARLAATGPSCRAGRDRRPRPDLRPRGPARLGGGAGAGAGAVRAPRGLAGGARDVGAPRGGARVDVDRGARGGGPGGTRCGEQELHVRRSPRHPGAAAPARVPRRSRRAGRRRPRRGRDRRRDRAEAEVGRAAIGGAPGEPARGDDAILRAARQSRHDATDRPPGSGDTPSRRRPSSPR